MLKLKLIGSERIITFRDATNSDRHAVLRQMSDDRRGPSAEELLAARCLVSVDGEKVRDPQLANRMDGWPVKDVQHYQAVFVRRNFLDGPADAQMIEDDVKKLEASGSNFETEAPDSSAEA